MSDNSPFDNMTPREIAYFIVFDKINNIKIPAWYSCDRRRKDAIRTELTNIAAQIKRNFNAARKRHYTEELFAERPDLAQRYKRAKRFNRYLSAQATCEKIEKEVLAETRARES